MILNSTKYKNPERTISGLSNFVTNADTIILCDTSSGIVYLTLLEIPNDQWNTNYKLYVVDKSNNAGTNAIAIFAPAGYTINNQSSLIISTNGGGVVISVASNTGYLGLATSGSGNALAVLNQGVQITPSATSMNFLGIQATAIGNDVTIQNAFISIDNTSILALISSSGLLPNQTYNITDAVFGRSIYKHNVYVTATAINQLATSGLGQFFNADFQSVGNYSGVSGFVSQTGIWQSSSTYSIGDIAIWNNLHFKNITGSNGSSSPNSDAVNWLELAYSETNGYIVEIDYINYDVLNNFISSRTDVVMNQVEYYDTGSVCSLNEFMWGKNGVNQNKVIGNSIFSIANTIINKTIANNFVFNSEVYLQNNGIDPALTGAFNDNVFWNAIRICTFSLVNIVSACEMNEFREVNGISNMTISDATFSRNNVVQGSVGVCEFRNNALIRDNTIINTSFLLNKKGGLFENNYANNSSIQIDGSTGNEQQNVLNNSTLQVLTNEGSINLNNLTDSVINIQFNSPTGLIVRNNMQSNSTVLISNVNNGSIGDGGVKGVGNVFANSTLEIDILGAGKQIFGNEFYQSQLTMTTMQGSFFGCFVKSSLIEFDVCSGFVFNSLTLHNATFGNASYVVPQSFVGGEYIFGNCSISVNLDCSDPAIYDGGLQKLTIPAELSSFVGVITLQNAGGITIKNIVGVNSIAKITFLNDAGTTTFVTVGVGVALSGEIVSNQVAPYSFNITYRLSGTDYIRLQSLGAVNGVMENGIFV